ncbi:MAG: Flp family type IVb pilin [Erysipelotrichaceae bacterium]|nr:Flp family type IVb pilin [Erysipelotrichaceae bacterium]
MLKNFYNDESGQGMVEYGLLVALIALVAVVGVTKVGPAISEMFENVASQLPAGE